MLLPAKECLLSLPSYERDARPTVRWDRPPPAASSIPSTLLHPIFGKFIGDCENYEPTAANLVWSLSTAMSGFF